MDTKYTYLLRRFGETRISAYYVPYKMMPISLSKIFEMLRLTHSTLRKFQIGIQMETDGKKEIIWHPNIYKICESVSESYKLKKDEIPLDKDFNLICGAKLPPTQVINKILQTESILR